MIERAVGGLHEHLYGLLEARADFQRGSILDVGCGTGAWLCRVRALGFERLVGIDYVQPDQVENLDLRQLDIDKAPGCDLGQHDVVTCIEVIEHIENIGRLLDLISAGLRQEGVAIITTPNIESLRARVRGLATGRIPFFDEKSDPTHLCPILRDSLQKMLRRRGLFIKEIYQYPPARRHSLMFGKWVTSLANLLRALLLDELYGDNTIYFIRRIRERSDV